MISFFNGILPLVIARCIAGVLAQGPTELTGAQWIWAGTPSGGNYPVGNATFRRNYSPPSGRVPISANISITADNAYTLYVNGVQIGDGGDFHHAEGYCVRLDSKRNVFAVEAQNGQLPPNLTTLNPAGLLAAIGIRFSDGFTDMIGSNNEWHAVAGTPAGFEQVAFDDSAWPAAFPQGDWPNTAPWGNISQPVLNQDISCSSINLAPGNSKPNVGAIVGGVVGGVGGLLIIAGLAVWLRRRKHKALSTVEMQRHSVYAPFNPDVVDRSLAGNGGEPVILASSNPSRTLAYHPPLSPIDSATGVSFYPPSSTSQDLRAEIERLRREMDALRSERFQGSEPQPLYPIRR